MELEALGTQEKWAKAGATHKATLTYADLTETTADTDQTIAAKNAVAGQMVEVIGGKLVTAFKDASDAALNSTVVSVGDGADPNHYLASWQVNENGTEASYFLGTGVRGIYTAADTIDVLVESMVGKSLSNIDTGELVLYLAVTDLS